MNGEPLHDLTGFRRDLLIAINKLDKPNGLEVVGFLEESGYPEINQGRLYPNLQEIVDKGLVIKGSYDDRTNKYSLSRRGSRELTRYCQWVCKDD